MGDLFLIRTGCVEARLDGRRLVIRFICPDARNPISNEVIGSLESIVDECERTGEIEEATFAGTGGRHTTL